MLLSTPPLFHLSATASSAAQLSSLFSASSPAVMALDLQVDFGVGLDPRLQYKVWEPQLILVAWMI